MTLYSVFTYTHYKPFFITVSMDLALKTKYWSIMFWRWGLHSKLVLI